MATFTLTIYWLYVFLLEEELVSKNVLERFFENKLSLLDRKFSRSTGRSINAAVLLCFKYQQTCKQEG